jgi:hypothetical protein
MRISKSDTPCFLAHVDYFGTDDQLGPVAVSMVREVSEKKQRVAIHSHTLYRIIVRISDVRFSENFEEKNFLVAHNARSRPRRSSARRCSRKKQ